MILTGVMKAEPISELHFPYRLVSVVAHAVTGGLCVLAQFCVLYVYIYMYIYILYIWGGVGWGINVLTTTSLILCCQGMFHQLGRP